MIGRRAEAFGGPCISPRNVIAIKVIINCSYLHDLRQGN